MSAIFSRRTVMAGGIFAVLAAAAGASFIPSEGAFAWGGYANGYIPTTSLSKIPWSNPAYYLRSDATTALIALNTSFVSAFGYNLPINDGYRSYQSQVDARNYWCSQNDCSAAAVPGTSNHGWALAIDVAIGRYAWNHDIYKWLKSHASTFGWFHPDWAEPTGRIPEAWHWEYSGGYTEVPTDIPSSTEANEMQTIIAAPNGTVVHLSPAGKVNFGSADQYRNFRQQVDTLRNAGATNMMPLPPLEQVVNVSWDTYNFLCQINGVSSS